jgi:precorrin-6Y C5,15-methyltransferase (decarboxylating)
VTTAGLVDTCYQALAPGGRLVANAVTLESEQIVFESRERHGGNLTRLSVAHAGPVGSFTAWRPQLPVTQWHVEKSA